MYEHHLEKFNFITSDTPYCAIEFTIEPFKGVKLYLGTKIDWNDIGTDDQTVAFDYDIFDLPEGFQIDPVVKELEEHIKGIFLAILEERMGPKPDNNEEKGQ